jgi:hypothetical protein
MANFARAHLLLRIHGGFGPVVATPIERWSVGMRIDINATGTVSELAKAQFLSAIAGDVSTFHSDSDVKAGTNCSINSLTAAYIGTDGHYVGGNDQDTTIHPLTAPFGTGSTLMPWEVSRVFTLRTAVGRGRAHVGRFYWPNSSPVGTDGLWPSTECNMAGDAAAQLLSAINAAALVSWPTSDGIAVFSGLGSGEVNTVTRVEVGRAPDTQRRRNNRLAETYQGWPVTTTSEDEVAKAWTLEG